MKSIYLSIYSVYMSIYLSIYLFIYLSTVSIDLSIYGAMGATDAVEATRQYNMEYRSIICHFDVRKHGQEDVWFDVIDRLYHTIAPALACVGLT